MSKLNRDMVGKVAGIWFPISTYVIVDFEHVLASMFFLSCAKMNGSTIPIESLLKFLVPSTLGNLFGGALLVGCLAILPKKSRLSVNRY
jgi:formate transporter